MVVVVLGSWYEIEDISLLMLALPRNLKGQKRKKRQDDES